MDETVHGFVVGAIPPLQTRIRNEVAYKNNGWKNVYEEDKDPAKKDKKKEEAPAEKKDEKKSLY